MKKNLVLIALSLPAILVTLTSCQTTSKSPTEDRFAKADTNRDGKLSPNEASDYFAQAMFVASDTNHDGKLTWEEWRVSGPDQSKPRFKSADTNKDGSLSLDEALVYGRARGIFRKNFRDADTNNDGYVTREEAQAYSGSREGPPR